LNETMVAVPLSKMADLLEESSSPAQGVVRGVLPPLFLWAIRSIYACQHIRTAYDNHEIRSAYDIEFIEFIYASGAHKLALYHKRYKLSLWPRGHK